MSETSQLPPAPVGSDPIQKRPRVSRRRYIRHLLWGTSGLMLLLVIGIVAVYFWASSQTFENIIRKRLIARIETATGARTEIRSFRWNLLKLQLEADGIVLHGREAPGETPFAQVDHVFVDIDILDLWSPRVLLRDLTVVKPQIHLIAYADGTTNQPQPPRKTESHPIDTLFDLQARHVEVQHGAVDYDNRSDQVDDFQDRRIPLDFGANDVSLLLKYQSPSRTAPAPAERRARWPSRPCGTNRAAAP